MKAQRSARKVGMIYCWPCDAPVTIVHCCAIMRDWRNAFTRLLLANQVQIKDIYGSWVACKCKTFRKSNCLFGSRGVHEMTSTCNHSELLMNSIGLSQQAAVLCKILPRHDWAKALLLCGFTKHCISGHVYSGRDEATASLWPKAKAKLLQEWISDDDFGEIKHSPSAAQTRWSRASSRILKSPRYMAKLIKSLLVAPSRLWAECKIGFTWNSLCTPSFFKPVLWTVIF